MKTLAGCDTLRGRTQAFAAPAFPSQPAEVTRVKNVARPNSTKPPLTRPHTPGPWSIWTGSSWRRIGSESTQTEVATPIICASDGHPDMLFPNGGADGP